MNRRRSNRDSTEGYRKTAICSLLEIVRELVSGLIQLDVVHAREEDHSHASVLTLLDGTSKLRSFRSQLGDSRVEVVAHQRDGVMTRAIVGFAFPFAVRRVNAHLTRT